MCEAHVLLHSVLFNSQIVQFGRYLCNETNELDHKTDLNYSLTNKWEGFVRGSIKSIRVIRESTMLLSDSLNWQLSHIRFLKNDLKTDELWEIAWLK